MKRNARQGRSRAVALMLLLALAAPPVARGEGQENRPAASEGRDLSEERLSDLLQEGPGDERIPASPSITGAFLRMLGWTAAVLAVGGAILLLVKKYTPAGQMLSSGRWIRVMGRTALSGRHSIYVIRVSNQKLLIVGVSGDRMVTLGEISDPTGVVAADDEFREELDSISGAYGTAEIAGREGSPAGISGEPDLSPYRWELQRIRDIVGGWRKLVRPRVSDREAEEIQARSRR